MTIKTIHNDIIKLKKALQLIEQTENYLHFNKAHLIFEICEQITVLEEKNERQINYLRSLNEVQ